MIQPKYESGHHISSGRSIRMEEVEGVVVEVGVDPGDDDVATCASEGAAPAHDRDLIGGRNDEALKA